MTYSTEEYAAAQALEDELEANPSRKLEIVARHLLSGEPLNGLVRAVIAENVNPPKRKLGQPRKPLDFAIALDVHERRLAMTYEEAVEQTADSFKVGETHVRKMYGLLLAFQRGCDEIDALKPAAG
ncbi:MAG: hypothetical protein ABL956_13035 [Hyphomonadaceae bacterium]